MMNSTEQNEGSFFLNVLPLAPREEEITIGLHGEASDDRVRTHYLALPKVAHEYFPDRNNKNPYLYIQFAEPGNSEVKVVVKLTEHPAVAQKYYTWYLLKHFQAKNHYVRFNFVKDLEVWLPYEKSNKVYPFARFNLKVTVNGANTQPSLRVSFIGFSYILARNLMELDQVRPEAIAEVTRVVYKRRIYTNVRDLPEEALSNRSKVFPILNRRLAEAAGINYPMRRNQKKHSISLNMIHTFAEKHLFTDELAEILPLPAKWLAISGQDADRLEGTEKSYLFGNGQVARDIYTGLLKYEPYRPLHHQQIRVFFIYHQDDSGACEHLAGKMNTRDNPSSGLSRFIKAPTYFDRNMDIVFQNKSNPTQEVLAAIDKLSLQPETGYLGIYLSPYDKYVSSDRKHRIYYLIKEALLQRNIASQTIDRDKMMQAGTSFRYWMPNLGMAVIAKLGGVPWILNKPGNNDLIVGFGLYATRKYNMRVIGSSVCFANDGRFEEFDFFPENENFRVAAALEKALHKYVSRHKGVDRIVIHYYKEISKKTFSPIREMIQRFQPGVPVIVIHINSTRTAGHLVQDRDSKSGLPLNGSYFHLGRHHYLLYINDYEDRDIMPRHLPLPVKLSLKSSDPLLLDDKDYVKGLLGEVYSFSNLYWRSIVQPPVPVTINYPKMLAGNAVWFKRQSLQGTAAGVPWFL